MGSVTVMFALLMMCLGTLHSYEVAFSAAKTKHHGKGRIIYDAVYINDRHGYNPRTGVFRAPCIGVYSFTYNFLTYPRHCVIVKLYKNRSLMSNSYACDKNGYGNGGNTVILLLRKGDKIWLNNVAGKIYGNKYATFNGQMLTQFWDEDNAENATIDNDNQADLEVEVPSDEIETEMEI